VTVTFAAEPSVDRVGILGGTFNPPHLGHLALARHAHQELGLGRVLLMPAHRAPNKSAVSEDPGPEHRLRMCRLAVASESGLEASALEIERGGTSYTVDTLQAIHDAHPNAELTLIVGADTGRTLPAWREPVRLLEMADVAVAERGELGGEDARAAVLAMAGLASPPRVRLLRMERVAVSSSDVRERVAAGAPVAQLVGAAVARYIAEHGLYGAGNAAVAGIGGST
jgi:nicotinate-nucleotide adenylyltransferase